MNSQRTDNTSIMNAREISLTVGLAGVCFILLVSMSVNFALWTTVVNYNHELAREKEDHIRSLEKHLRDIERIKRLEAIIMKRKNSP